MLMLSRSCSEQTNLRRHFGSKSLQKPDLLVRRMLPLQSTHRPSTTTPGGFPIPASSGHRWLRHGFAWTEISIPSAARQEIAFLCWQSSPGRHGEGNFVAQHFNSCPKWNQAKSASSRICSSTSLNVVHAPGATALRLCASRPCGESDLLGITARGAITALGRALVEPTVREEQLALTATAILPPVAEEFVAQADLTLVVPGPPSPALRRLLSLVADVESTGGAAVYRVTADSAARALGSGLSPADLIAELNTRSATPLPQPLEYMINDAARRHGGVRVGTTASWISSDDESVIAQLLSDPQAARLGLTRLAPSVIASTAPAEELMTLAASAGHIPTVVGADGESVPLSRPVHRSPDPARKDQPGVDDIFVVALTSALRRSELEEPAGVAIAAPRELPRMPTAATAQVLRRAQNPAGAGLGGICRQRWIHDEAPR